MRAADALLLRNVAGYIVGADCIHGDETDLQVAERLRALADQMERVDTRMCAFDCPCRTFVPART